MRRFQMKWPNRCQRCKVDISTGDFAYGMTNENGKWVFECDKCHDAPMDVVDDELMAVLGLVSEKVIEDVVSNEKTTKDILKSAPFRLA